MSDKKDDHKARLLALFLGVFYKDKYLGLFCLIGLAFVGYFGYIFGITMYFWILLVCWLVFISFYYFKKEMLSQKIYLIIFIILVIMSGLLVFNAFPGISVVSTNTGLNTNTGSGAKNLVDCSSTTSSPLSKVAGWNTYMYPASPTSTGSTPRFSDKTAQKDSYSFASLKNSSKVDNIYYLTELTDRSTLPADYKIILEVCDSNNKVVAGGSTRDTKTKNSGSKVRASYSWLQTYFINEQAVPGDFRADGYLFANGKWTLTNRIDKVQLVK